MMVQLRIEEMVASGWIKYWGIVRDNEALKILNRKEHYFDTCDIQTWITREGRDAYDKEKQIRYNETLIKSQIDTNTSVNETNTISRYSLIISGILAFISAAFVVITGVKACNDNTEAKVEAITIQMKLQKSSFDSINNSLKRLYQAVEKNRLDTTK